MHGLRGEMLFCALYGIFQLYAFRSLLAFTFCSPWQIMQDSQGAGREPSKVRIKFSFL